MILFFHNTAAPYRIPLFKRICKNVDATFVFTRMEIAENIYNIDKRTISLDGINHKILSKNLMEQLLVISELMDENNVTAVMVPTLDSFIELLQAAYIYYVAKRKKKHILFYVEHWDAPNDLKPFWQIVKDTVRNIFTRIISHGADTILINGTKTQQYLSKLHVSENKIQVVYSVSEMPAYTIYDDIRNKYCIGKEKRIVLYFGRIIKRKGLDVLLKAYAELDIDTKKKMHLVVCGEGEFEEECKALAVFLGIENITWVGSVHPDKRYEYFNQCDIFVLPSYFYHGKAEVWGLTINEAIQCGKAIISTTAVGAAHELINESNGRIVRENNVNDLKEALESVVNSSIMETAVLSDHEIYQRYNYNNSADIWCDILGRYDNKEKERL